MKCSNCSSDAQYAVIDAGVSPAYYCNSCLPTPLQARANAGQLDLPKVEAPKEDKKKAASKTSEATTDEDPTA